MGGDEDEGGENDGHKMMVEMGRHKIEAWKMYSVPIIYALWLDGSIPCRRQHAKVEESERLQNHKEEYCNTERHDSPKRRATSELPSSYCLVFLGDKLVLPYSYLREGSRTGLAAPIRREADVIFFDIQIAKRCGAVAAYLHPSATQEP